MLQEDEVITPDGISASMGHAEGDLGEEVSTDEPYVVAVHASEDAYDTIIACGSIDGPQSLEERQNLIHIQPVGDATNFGYAVLDGSTLNTYLFQPNAEPIEATTPVGGEMDFRGYPVDLHSGVCTDFTAEPAHDLGDLVQTNVYAEGEQEAGDVEGKIPAEAEEPGRSTSLNPRTLTSGTRTFSTRGPHVVAVQESPENNGTVVACGQVLPVMDDDTVVVFLHPVGGGNQVGYVEMGQEGSDANGYLWNVESFEQPESETSAP